MADGTFWKRCSTCKKPISYAAGYYACSVSTCNRKGTDFAFCSVECWEAHVPLLRHRDAWADERRAPASAAEVARRSERSTGARDASPAAAPRPLAEVRRGAPVPERPTVEPRRGPAAPERPPLEWKDRSEIPEDVLVVASKLKAYIRARAGMNTSDGVLPVLSDVLRDLCDAAIERAHADGRKTVMARDLA